MKVSIKQLQDISNVDISPNGIDALVAAIGLQLGAVESVDSLADKYKGVTIAKVIRCEPHPNADKLKLCWLDDNKTVDGVTRDDAGLVEVVCGADNVAADQLVAWIPPGAVVPSTFHSRQPIILEAKKLRGVVSNGMIASPLELDLGDDHDGIMVLERGKIGESFASAYDLDDTVIDLENKMFTHRPDCFGTLGVAREFAAIQGQQFESPEWYVSEPQFDDTDELPLSASIDDTGRSLRFMTVAMKDVKVEPSPDWLQTALTKVGIKPVNNVVDVTNYVMHLTAQPLHAYDYDKLKKLSRENPDLQVRLAQQGESITLLNGKTAELQPDTTVIATDTDVVGIAGVMGGSETEVDESTTRIALECAHFEMYSIRRAAMHYGLFTDAVARFNKGQSPHQNDRVLSYCMAMLSDIAGAVQASAVVDVYPAPPEIKSLSVNTDFVNSRLGAAITPEDMQRMLERLEFDVSRDGLDLTITPPFWRQDIAISEDIVEEIGRLYGYHQLTLQLPQRRMRPTARNRQFDTNQDIRQRLAAAGANEVLTYSFVKAELLASASQDPKHAYKIRNALSPELQYYRLSLTPSLLEHVYPNIRAGNQSLALFEINPVHSKELSDPLEPTLPKEQQRLSLVVSQSDKSRSDTGAAYYQAQAYLRQLLDSFHISFYLAPLESSDSLDAPFATQRSAVIYTKNNNQKLGVIGEFTASLRRDLKLPEYTAGFEIDVELINELREAKPYYPLSKYPATTRDVTVKIEKKIPFSDLYAYFSKTLNEKNDVVDIKPLNIFDPEDDSRHISFRLTFRSYEGTLSAEEVNRQLAQLTELITSELNAQIV